MKTQINIACGNSSLHNPPESIDPNSRKRKLIGLPREMMKEELAKAGLPLEQINMRVAQLWNWIYVRGATGFPEMMSLSKTVRSTLNQHFTLTRPEIVNRQISTDGTRKWLLRTQGDGTENSSPGDPFVDFECVFIPEAKRGTLCLSSQVGCTLNCSFCYTGTQRLVRNLTSAEIVGQIMVARDEIGEWPGVPRTTEGPLPDTERMITNIVLMGMGEPLYNFENTQTAMNIAADNAGLNFSKRRITLSTSGVAPKIPLWGAETDSMLAISLHATRDSLRDILVPINKKYPIETLLAACRSYPGLGNARRITFEYVMLKDVNDSDEDAKALVKLLAGIPAKINLIPFNSWPGSGYDCPQSERIEKFAQIINKAGYASPVRAPRGRDIMAACGQLKSESEKSHNRNHKKHESIPESGKEQQQ
ncbi:MAG: 23S rRNA (adenine(2503)-C(2))-methyltransferase RlmN [Alphaproteobacteria bacterium]|nr:23S rRNA (adenine(2503)-C(2))-methyltransferase RlmN [Alphaproteobacteria bacterium]